MPFGQLSGKVAVQHGSYVTYIIKPDQTIEAFAAESFTPSAYPPPAGLTELVHLTTNGSYVLYVKEDGTVGGWGADTNNQVSGPSALTNPLYISARRHAYFVDQSGALTIWGDNFANAATPPPEATDLIIATGGVYHSVALKADGTVLAWGQDTRGQATVPAGLNDVIDLAAGSFHNIALKSDGTVVAWGYNNNGQTDVPVGLSDVIQVQCGYEHSIALKSDGTVVAWGRNSQGQCNVPAGLNTVVQISCSGGSFALAVLSDETVVWWGHDGSATGDPIPPVGTLVYFPTSGVNGQLDSGLDFEASFVGSLGPRGELAAALDFAAGFSGAAGAGGLLAADLQFSAGFLARSVNEFGVIDAGLGFTSNMTGYQDWLVKNESVQLTEINTLTITGDETLDDLVVPISSWQATSQAGDRASYLQAVIPAAADLIERIQDREAGDLVIRKGYRLPDGSMRMEELISSNFGTLRYDRGPSRFTVTVSGYRPPVIEKTGIRTLTGVRSISMSDGKRRVRCDIDLFLQPGMTAFADGIPFRADFINYYVSEADKFCEVGER